MDVLGFVCNIIDAANYILKSADTCMNIMNAPSDIRHQIEDVKNRAIIARQCGVAMQSWRDEGEPIPIEYLGPAKNARKAYQEAMSYLQEKIRKCEEGNRAKKLFGKAQYAVKGKERAAFVARRVIDTTDTLKHMVEMRVHLADTSLSARFRPFLDKAWQHSVDDGIKSPMDGMDLERRMRSQRLEFGDCISVAGEYSDRLFQDRIFVDRHPDSDEDDTKLLASLLSADVDGVGQKFGLLQCVGYNNGEANPDALFKRPNAMREPMTLRALIMSEESKSHTLCDRLNFARILTTSLVIHHSLGIVHKSICPESILVFRDMVEPGDNRSGRHYRLGTPYLLAFDQARSERTASGKLYVGERNVRRDLYVYPEHLWTQRTRAFETRDDVFGLGICLLEIGLWKSIFKVTVEDRFEHPDYDEWAKDLKEDHKDTSYEKKWKRVEKLIELARNELPKTMGAKYASAVISCLVMDLPDEHKYKPEAGDREKEAEEKKSCAMDEETEEKPQASIVTVEKTHRQSSTIERLQNTFRSLMMVPSLISSYRTKRKIEQATRELLEEQLVKDEESPDEESLGEKAESDDTLVAGKEESTSKPAEPEKSKALSAPAPDNTPLSDVNHLSRKSKQNLAFVTDVLKKLYSIRM